MGFSNISNKISQSLFYFFILGEGGPRGHEHNLYVYATLLTIYIMGFSDIVYLIKERINNMSKENITTRELIQSITNKDSLTAVRVAMNINDLQDKTIEKTINVIQDMDKNMKLLAVKVLELEKKLEAYEQRKN